jgi:hypothetical protein
MNQKCCVQVDRDNYSRSQRVLRALTNYNHPKCLKQMASNYFSSEPNPNPNLELVSKKLSKTEIQVLDKK